MSTCIRGNFHVSSLFCHSLTLRDSRCSSLCSVHGRFENPSYLVLKLILALIWNIRSPFQFSKCRNSRVKTINFATIDAITMALELRSFRKDRSRIRSRLITRSPRQFAYHKVPTTTRFYAIAYPRVKKSTNRYAKLEATLQKCSSIHWFHPYILVFKYLIFRYLHYNYMREIPYGFFKELKDILRV